MLEGLTKEEIETYKKSLRNKYLLKLVGQWERAMHLWEEITNRRYLYNKSNEMAELLNSLEKENILEFYKVGNVLVRLR